MNEPPSVEELPLESGSFVELHTLSRQDMNGKTGEVVKFDSSLGRFLVKLDDDCKTIKVKPITCKRIPLMPMREKMRRGLITTNLSLCVTNYMLLVYPEFRSEWVQDNHTPNTCTRRDDLGFHIGS